MKEKIVAIIPARYASTRLPGKPLLDMAGRPMILHVVERVKKCGFLSRVIVATDDRRVFEAVSRAGHEARMTSPAHRTGTDRLAEVAAEVEAGLVVNVQGDEPLIEATTIELAVAPLLSEAGIVMSTTSESIGSPEDVVNPNVVKVVVDRNGDALYFSRNPIPFPRAAVAEHGSVLAALRKQPELLRQFAKHTGMYVYRREFLLGFSRLASTPLEQFELLEQMRALEHGYRIRVVPAPHASIGVDTPEDFAHVKKMIEQANP